MLGVAETATLFEGVLASRNPGDRSEFCSYVQGLVKAGIAPVFTAPGGKEPLDLRTTAMIRADVKKGAPCHPDGKVKQSWYAVINSTSRAKALCDRADEDGIAPNVGMNLGHSRIIAVDLDNAGDRTAFETWWSQHTSDPCPSLTVRSPGKKDDHGNWIHKDGGHIYLWVPEGVDSPALDSLSEKLSEPEKEAQSRKGWAVMAGEKRGVLLPPSVRAEGPYIYTGAPLITAPQWLVDALMGRASKTVAVDGTDQRDPAVAQWEDTTSWDSLLAPHGWEPTGNTDTCGCPTWTRPGKGVRGAKSAVAHEPSCTALTDTHKRGALHLYTDAGPAKLRGEQTWSKLAFVAAMNEQPIPQARAQLGLNAYTTRCVVLSFPGGVEIGMSTGAFHGVEDDGDDEDDDEPAEVPTLTVVPNIAPDHDDETTTDGVDSKLSTVTFVLDDGTEHTIDLSCQRVTSKGIEDTPTPSNDNPFGVKPISNQQISARGVSFWQKRPFLKRIYAEAYRHNCDPYSLLVTILVNLANHIPYWHVLPPRVGDAPSEVGRGGSLNSAHFLSGMSTAGKSEIIDIANELLPPYDRRQIGASTGQALMKEFAEVVKSTEDGADGKPVKVTERRKVRDTVHVTVDEGGQIWKETRRDSSNLFDVLRSMLMGKPVTNITNNRELYSSLRGGSYRLTYNAIGQNGTFEPLFTRDEMRAGTPQRFFYSCVGLSCPVPPPASWINEPLPTVPHFKGGTPAPFANTSGFDQLGVTDTEVLNLPVPIPRSPGGKVYFRFMDAVRRACVRQSMDENVTPEQLTFIEERAVAFHLQIMWFRLEALLAVADGAVDSDGVIRPDSDPIYAELADDLMLHQMGTLAYVFESVKNTKEVDDMEDGGRLGVKLGAADAARKEIARRGRLALKRRLTKFLKNNGPTPRSQLRNRLRGGDERDLFDSLMTELIEDDMLVRFDGHFYTIIEYKKKAQ